MTLLFEIVESDAVPEGTIMLLSPRRSVRITLPSGQVVEQTEPEEEWARRCAVLRVDP